MRLARQDSRDESGASAVEYGLLVALIAAVIVLAVFALGNVVHKSYGDTCRSLTGAPPMASSSANCNS